MSPSVSIVIPAYNNADFIAETVRSVLAQTHEDFELVIADHASTDTTREVLREFELNPRIRIIDTPAGGGAERNWNSVTAQAKGEFIKLVCGDDIIYPTCIADQLAAFESGVDMVSSRRDIVDADGRPVMSNRGLPRATGRINGRQAIRQTVRSGANIFGEPAMVMFRREALERAGLWDSTEHYLIDEASYVRVLLSGDFVGLAQSHGAFRISGGQWSVRLVNTQAEETIAFHRKITRSNPGLLTRLDLLIGNTRARLLAQARRLVYLRLSDRMVKEHG